MIDSAWSERQTSVASGEWMMIRADGHVLLLVVEGNLEAVTGRAQALGALSVDVHPVSLRELFLERVQEEAS